MRIWYLRAPNCLVEREKSAVGAFEHLGTPLHLSAHHIGKELHINAFLTHNSLHNCANISI
jgi:hypothetical protein